MGLREKQLLLNNLDYVQKIYNSVFKGHITVGEESYELPCNVTITPYCTTEDDILGREHNVDLWSVEIAYDVPGDYWTPPDVDVVEVGEYRNAGSAMIEAIKLIAVENAMRVQEYLSEEAWAKEEEEARARGELSW